MYLAARILLLWTAVSLVVTPLVGMMLAGGSRVGAVPPGREQIRPVPPVQAARPVSGAWDGAAASV